MKGLMSIALIAIVFMFGCDRGEDMMAPIVPLTMEDTPQEEDSCLVSVRLAGGGEALAPTEWVEDPCGNRIQIGEDFFEVVIAASDRPDRTVIVDYNFDGVKEVYHHLFGSHQRYVETLSDGTERWMKTDNKEIMLLFLVEDGRHNPEDEIAINIKIRDSDGNEKDGKIRIGVIQE